MTRLIDFTRQSRFVRHWFGPQTIDHIRAFSAIASLHSKKKNSILASYYRGGTSRALLFHRKDLPSDTKDWPPIFLGTIGAPDPNGRQLDGMGGGISSLSKICVVAPSDRRDADIEFTFVQVGVKDDRIDYSGNCGNMSGAIRPFPIDTGLVRPSNTAGLNTTVSLYNTNTQKIIEATFPITNDGSETVEGDFAIDGVSGTAAKIQLDFVAPGSSKTGKLLPTGNTIDIIDGLQVTCIDAGNPCIFVNADELDVDGTLLPNETDKRIDLLERLESLRVKAAVAIGMANTTDAVPPSIPKICFVSKPASHKILSGETISADKVDVVVRAISTGQPHRALPITTGSCVSAAARLEGSVVHNCLSAGSCVKQELVIGHPSRTLVVGAFYDDEGKLRKSTVYGTARRLMEGRVFWK
ncbi:hypothetical protein EYB26_005044 [Talaromyces marneffei]|uniref:uncharacterized protein n=1 Tax=Talaromyces marneffei TaxID=37727 RepID=UPI0012AA2EB1|nr:uncharacterized protein EYB26_005044 [Talaromyces marneffei]QGA17373.1 hypothetical protein EYB26_005044 [Talaromyces marneffei]